MCFKCHSFGWRLFLLLKVVSIALYTCLWVGQSHCVLLCILHGKLLRKTQQSFVTVRWSIFHWVYKAKMGIKKGFISGLLCTKSLLKPRGIHAHDALAYLLQQERIWFHKTPPQWPWARHILQGYCPYKKMLVAFNEKMRINAILI